MHSPRRVQLAQAQFLASTLLRVSEVFMRGAGAGGERFNLCSLGPRDVAGQCRVV